MRKRLKASIAATAASLALTACGGGGDGGGDGGGGGQSASGCKPGTSGQTVTICMEEIKYVPVDAKVPVGAKVVWENSDTVPHTVTKEAGPGPDFDSGTMPVNDSFEQTFSEAGKIEYICTIHPSQRGTLTVQ